MSRRINNSSTRNFWNVVFTARSANLRNIRSITTIRASLSHGLNFGRSFENWGLGVCCSLCVFILLTESFLPTGKSFHPLTTKTRALRLAWVPVRQRWPPHLSRLWWPQQLLYQATVRQVRVLPRTRSLRSTTITSNVKACSRGTGGGRSSSSRSSSSSRTVQYQGQSITHSLTHARGDEDDEGYLPLWIELWALVYNNISSHPSSYHLHQAIEDHRKMGNIANSVSVFSFHFHYSDIHINLDA